MRHGRSEIEEFEKLSVNKLKERLKELGQTTSGKKWDLIERCRGVLTTASTRENLAKSKSAEEQFLKLSAPNKSKNVDIAYEKILKDAPEEQLWKKDLRGLPAFDFVRLYDYLVLTTKKYDHSSLRTAGYKKLKPFQFFAEGYIKGMMIAKIAGLTYLKGVVLASMKPEKRNVVIVFGSNGEVLKAACDCPAGIGPDGHGRCNHVGGILFAIEDFNRQGLNDHTEPVSCTSRLCSWNVPRNVKVDPKPVGDINITKFQYGKKSSKVAKSSLYDPRAPCDRRLDETRLNTMLSKLRNTLPSSSLFLFHDVKPNLLIDESIIIDSICEDIPVNVVDITEFAEQMEMDLPFNNNYDIASSKFKEMIDAYVEKVTDNDIKRIERLSRGQDNAFWRELKKEKLTASNFKAAATRRKEPDKLLWEVMYNVKETTNVPALQYGHVNEDNAVDDYVKKKFLEGNKGLRVWKVGTIVSRERPGYGASLDRMVLDPLAKGKKEGGLEIKCPISKQGMSVEDACSDKSFCMSKESGVPMLKPHHKYFYQVQGQMFVALLQWVDFVVWFGVDNIFIQRVYFNKKWWYEETLPKLDYFYRRAFLPEVLTRRVARGIPLYSHGGWKHFEHFAKRLRSR